MPAIVANATKFLLHSDYPNDKLVYKGQGNIVVPAFTSGTTGEAHGLPYTPLVYGSFSLSADYSSLYLPNSGPLSAAPLTSGVVFDATVIVYADATRVLYDVYNYTASPVTFYVSTHGMQPASSTANSPSISSRDRFKFSSDYNTVKILKSGYFDQAAGSGSPVTVNIPHNLGSDAQYMAWIELSGLGIILPSTYGDAGLYQSSDVSIAIDASNLMFYFSGSNPAYRLHYRIYLDQ